MTYLLPKQLEMFEKGSHMCPRCYSYYDGISCPTCKPKDFPTYKPKDDVNSPDHYNKGSIECKDYIREVLGDEGFIDYCHGNLIKYQHRWRHKGESLKDLSKAQVYLSWMNEVAKEISEKEGS